MKTKIALAAAIAMSSVAIVPAQTVHHSKHTMLKSVAAGVAAYEVAKHTGNRRAAAGGHKNFMQRHPVLTGVGAAMATHHYLKKH